MLGRNLSGSILKLPRRVGEDRRKLVSACLANQAGELVCDAFHGFGVDFLLLDLITVLRRMRDRVKNEPLTAQLDSQLDDSRMNASSLSDLVEKGFNVEASSHARAVLEGDFPDCVKEVISVLDGLSLPITASGSGTIALEIEWNNKDPFFDRDFENFKRLHSEGAISAGILITRGSSLQARMREFVYRFAVNKNLTSYEDLAAIGYQPPTPKQRVAVLKRVERTKNPLSFSEAWSQKFVSDKYGQATTHWDKAMSRLKRGVGNPCPLLLIGLPASIVQLDLEARIEVLPEDDEEETALDE